MRKNVVIAVLGSILALVATRIYSVHGQTTLVTNPPGGGIPFYNASGASIGLAACMTDSTTSATTTGLWSLSYSTIGFTSIRSVQVQAVSTASTAAGTVNAGMTTPSTSSVSGVTTVPAGSVLGLIPLASNPTSAVVYVTVCGLK